MTTVYTPRPYQARMSEAARTHDVLLGADPGLGKTVSVLDALDRMVFDELTASRILVVAPRIVASDTWPNEIAKWAQFRRLTHRVWEAADFGFAVREDNRLRPADYDRLRAKVLSDPARIHLVSRDHIYNLTLVLGHAWPYDVLVLDESWNFADPSSSRWKAAAAVREHKAPRMILMNGTIVGNRLEKLWAQMGLIDGGAALGETLAQFRMRYMQPDKMNPKEGKVYSWKALPGALEEIIERCRGQVLTMREEDWLTLPPLITREVGVQIPMAEYRQMERDLLLPFAHDREAIAVNAGVLYNKLAQIACGICFDTEREWHEIHREKLDALAEIAEGHGGPLLIWTSYQPDIQRIQALLPGAKVANKIKNLEQRWNAGEIPYLIAHPAMLAAGANLQDCPRAGMVWFGVTGNAEFWRQGVKRIHRSGRREPVVQYVILARGTVEETMQQIRGDREALEAQVSEALAYRLEEVLHEG